MRSLNDARIAFVVDALMVLGGAERLLEAVLELFPGAPIYTLVYAPKIYAGSSIAKREIHTSFINRWPAVRSKYRYYLPLLPLAVEQFDLRRYQAILSFSYAVAHGALARPDQLHICYKYTPLRQGWHGYQAFLEDAGLRKGLQSWIARVILHYIRLWDFDAAARVDAFIAPSQWVKQGIWRAYRRTAEVVYPPVEVGEFRPVSPRQEHFLVVSRMELHKKVDLVVEAFTRLGYPLTVVGDGQEYRRISQLAGPNVKLLGYQTDESVRRLMGQAKALVIAGEEDFSITAVEAQAAGCPVIAFGGGGVCETIIDGQTGLFFAEQTVESLMEAVERFNLKSGQFEPSVIRKNALQFSKERFQREYQALVEREWENHQGRASN